MSCIDRAFKDMFDVEGLANVPGQAYQPNGYLVTNCVGFSMHDLHMLRGKS